MKYFYLVVGLLAVVALSGFIFFQSTQSEVTQELVQYSDAEVGSFTVLYDTSEENAVLSLSGVQHNLMRVETETGTRYESNDGTIIFSEVDDVARVEMDGEIVFADATVTERRVEVLKSNKQGDPDANKYDFANDTCDDMDQDCTGSNGAREVEPACGPGTVLEDDICVPQTLDDDDDGDSIPTTDVSVSNNGGVIVIEPGATLTAAESLAFMADKTWYWSETIYSNDTSVTPANSSQFAAMFDTDGTFSSETDCNSIFGEYFLEGNSFTFGPLAATRMYCEASQEAAYAEMLGEVGSYMITDTGELVLMLKLDTGVMIFAPVVTDQNRATDYNSSRSNINSSNKR